MVTYGTLHHKLIPEKKIFCHRERLLAKALINFHSFQIMPKHIYFLSELHTVMLFYIFHERWKYFHLPTWMWVMSLPCP